MNLLLSMVLMTLLTSDLFVSGDITGTNPAEGDCLCFSSNHVNVRNAACGSVIGSANKGNCFKAKGRKASCILYGAKYEFFLLDYGGKNGWSAGNFVDTADAGSCGSGETPSEGYTCAITNEGKRIHETMSPTPFDCRDSGCGNTCRGGQCVAYVTCSCTRNGKHVPGTSCWRPGTKVTLPDGKCNRDIPVNTAIATFDSRGRYYAGHAAAFVGCSDDHTIKVMDQWCCRAVGYSTYGRGHRFFNKFAVITNPGVCEDRPSWNCRVESAGGTCCKADVSGC